MSDALRVLLVGLAAWRIGSLLVYERGPFAIFERLREVFTIGDGDDPGHLRREVSAALDCVWCITVWASIALWLLYPVAPQVVALLAAMTIAVVVERVRP